MSTTVDLDVISGAAWITLNGPASRNALDMDTVAALLSACDHIDADRSIGVAVITGADPAFCSGADRHLLDRIRALPERDRRQELVAVYAGFRRFGALGVPTVAAVNGPAVGAGVNLALAADLRVCSTTAGFTSGFAAIGLHPGGGHLHLIARTSNAAAAAAMGVFARWVDAAQAVRLGLVWDAVEPSRLRATVEEATGHLARDPDLARALASSFRESVRPLDQWDRAIAIELERQVWSLDRTPKES